MHLRIATVVAFAYQCTTNIYLFKVAKEMVENGVKYVQI